jgi:hypothetical protein
LKKDNLETEQKQETTQETERTPSRTAAAGLAALAVAGLALPAAGAQLNTQEKVQQATVEQSANTAQAPELSNEALEQLLKSADLKIGSPSVRVVKALEIRPGSVLSVQYDR